MKPVHIVFSILVLFEIFLIIQGCHSGGNNPALPSFKPGTDQTISNNPGSPSTPGISNTVADTPALWGLYSVIYNASSHDIQAVPMRGPAFSWNVVTFLQPPAGLSKNMVVSVLDDSNFATEGRIDVRVILHHPFPGQQTYTGFDVCGIFMTEGPQVSPQNQGVTYANPAVDPTLLNPDGYTRWLNPTEFLTGDVLGFEPGVWGTSESSENSGFLAGATINPYKYFSQGLGPDQSLYNWVQNPAYIANRGMFPSGATCSRDYELLFPIVQGYLVFTFNYAVLANWATPDFSPPVNPVVDFPINANAEYPLHIFATDRSQVFHTPDESGGTLSFDLEIFDWDAVLGHSSIPEEVSRIVIWSDNPLVPGGSSVKMSDEVEWNSGFTASMSTATIEILDAVPDTDGDTHVWIAVESANPSSYDQGFGAKVPDDPIATYVQVPVNVKNCPKAFLNGMDTTAAGIGTFLNDVAITGEHFENGDGLAVYLELEEAGEGSGPPEKPRIYGTDVKYVDNGTLTADFDLQGALLGHYGCGCINGCGIETPPDENKIVGKIENFDIVMPTPLSLNLSTNRTSSAPATFDTLAVSWADVGYDALYNLYLRAYNLNDDLVYTGKVTGTKVTHYSFSMSTFLIPTGGMIELYVTATGSSGDYAWESIPSTKARAYYQNFESSMGHWTVAEEYASDLRFVRSTSYANYSGVWGLKTYGYVPDYKSIWAALISPAIPEVKGATTVHYEFVHRHKTILPTNGYQIGWCNTIPLPGSASFDGYHPITSTAYGFAYNDTDCTALQTEFGVTSSTDQNYQTDQGSTYIGWYTSGFNASCILGDGKPNYLVLGLAGNAKNYLEVDIDEAVILIY